MSTEDLRVRTPFFLYLSLFRFAFEPQSLARFAWSAPSGLLKPSREQRPLVFSNLDVGHLCLLVDSLQDTCHNLARTTLVAILEASAHDVGKTLLELHRVGHLGSYKRKPNAMCTKADQSPRDYPSLGPVLQHKRHRNCNMSFSNTP